MIDVPMIGEYSRPIGVLICMPRISTMPPVDSARPTGGRWRAGARSRTYARFELSCHCDVSDRADPGPVVGLAGAGKHPQVNLSARFSAIGA